MSSARCGRRRPPSCPLLVSRHRYQDRAAGAAALLRPAPPMAVACSWPQLCCVAFLGLPAVVLGGSHHRHLSPVLGCPARLELCAARRSRSISVWPERLQRSPGHRRPRRCESARRRSSWAGSCRRDGRRLRHEEARPLALYLLGIPLASPKSEVHHLAFMLPAAALTAARCWWPSGSRSRTFLIAAFVAARSTCSDGDPGCERTNVLRGMIVLGLTLIVLGLTVIVRVSPSFWNYSSFDLTLCAI